VERDRLTMGRQCDEGRLAGKATIVTGAGAGIGRATAIAFGRAGASVACLDIDLGSAEETAAEVAGGRSLAFGVDVRDEGDLMRASGAVLEEWKRIDALYANAGIAGNGRAGDITREEWDRVLAVNLTGVWLSVRSVLGAMEAQRCGSIICQASVGGIAGVPGIAAYAASKGGVVALTKQLAADYSGLGIRFNAIAPGMIWTKLVEDSFRSVADDSEGFDPEAVQNAAKEAYPLRALGTVEQVAQLAVYLAGDESSWTTGTINVLDGGMTAVAYEA
jgi:NAD(P)-dependent dehydrogenase (short-subunit alcohol dehydrogenase family)